VTRPEHGRTALESAKRASVGQLLFKCARLLNEEALGRVRTRAGAPALRPSHTTLFPHIDLEGTRLTTLAVRLGITKQGVGQLVQDLERLGVVERTPDPSDGRAKLVRFTARGRRGLMHGLGVLRELEDELGGSVGRKRMQILHGILLDLHDVLEQRARRADV
jgi:DNA-binding MarR family transcriptional regulator